MPTAFCTLRGNFLSVRSFSAICVSNLDFLAKSNASWEYLRAFSLYSPTTPDINPWFFNVEGIGVLRPLGVNTLEIVFPVSSERTLSRICCLVKPALVPALTSLFNKDTSFNKALGKSLCKAS